MGRVSDAYFKSVDQTPLAAASIGQVHLATTYAGERVVVKAIYPEIRRYLIADLEERAESGADSASEYHAIDGVVRDAVDAHFLSRRRNRSPGSSSCP